jgi:mono/diheme cytochrome c family protein
MPVAENLQRALCPMHSSNHPMCPTAPPHAPARGRQAVARLAATALGWLVGVFLFGSVGAQAAPAGLQPAVVYHNYCSVCHGDKGDGNSRASGALSTPPRNFRSEASKRELTRERITAAITHGVPGTAMVSWKSNLSAADIAALADHVLTHFVQGESAGPNAAAAAISGSRAHGGREADAGTAPTSVDMTVAFPQGLKGDARRGAAFYQANCVACHGARGDGAGPRAYFINPKPRNFTDAASRARFNRVALFAAVSEGRNGSEMPAWSKVATPQQIGDVAEYVFQAFVLARRGDAAGATAQR